MLRELLTIVEDSPLQSYSINVEEPFIMLSALHMPNRLSRVEVLAGLALRM